MRDSLFDTNSWIAVTFPAHPLHAPAIAAFAAVSARHRVLFCRATQQSFLRLMTNKHVMAPLGLSPLSNHDALLRLDAHLAHAAVGLIDEPKSIVARWRAFADLPTASPNRWMDAYLAAFAMEAGVDFVTSDGAFASYAGLNPTLLVAPVAPSPPPASTGSGSTP